VVASRKVDKTVEITFDDILNTTTGGTVTIPVKLFIEPKQISGTTEYIIDEIYSNLSLTNSFSGLTVDTIGRSNFDFTTTITSTFQPIPTPTPTPTLTLTPTPTPTLTLTPTITPSSSPLPTKQSFASNQTNITIVDNNVSSSYPITFTVSGITKTSTFIEVSLSGFSHNYPGDVGMLITSPTNNYSLLRCANSDSTPAINVNVNLGLMYNNIWNGFSSGNFINNNSVIDNMPFQSPSPFQFNSGDTPPSFSVFSNLAPGDINGTWNLWIQDFYSGDSGTLSAVTLTIHY
jgi:subtilisin-like proprotein convertase family protein